MHRKIFNAAYLWNVVIQSFINLLFPLAAGFGLGWLLVTKLSLPEWIYAPLMIAGLMVGLFSMIKFLVSALDTLDGIEKEQKKSKSQNNSIDTCDDNEGRK